MTRHSGASRLTLVYAEYGHADSVAWPAGPPTPHRTLALFKPMKRSATFTCHRKHGLLLRIDSFVTDQDGAGQSAVIVIQDPGRMDPASARDIARRVADILQPGGLGVRAEELTDFIQAASQTAGSWVRRVVARGSIRWGEDDYSTEHPG